MTVFFICLISLSLFGPCLVLFYPAVFSLKVRKQLRGTFEVIPSFGYPMLVRNKYRARLSRWAGRFISRPSLEVKVSGLPLLVLSQYLASLNDNLGFKPTGKCIVNGKVTYVWTDNPALQVWITSGEQYDLLSKILRAESSSYIPILRIGVTNNTFGSVGLCPWVKLSNLSLQVIESPRQLASYFDALMAFIDRLTVWQKNQTHAKNTFIQNS